MYEQILEKLNTIEKAQLDDHRKINEIYGSLLGNKLERRKGYLDQIDDNTEKIVELDNKIDRVSKPYGKILAGTAAGVTGGGLLGAKWTVIMQKILTFFS